MTIEIKAVEQYFPVVLFIRLYKMILTFKSVDKILKYDHSNKSQLSSILYFSLVLFIILYKVVLFLNVVT